MERIATIERDTRETEIRLTLNLDGSGASNIDTGVPFMDHMLRLMSAHGFMDLDINARGDTEIDDHHTVEDTGICFGTALSRALGDKAGIRRYGFAVVPMDEALARVVLDISNRPFLCYSVDVKPQAIGSFDVGLSREFFRAVVNNSGITAHVDLIRGEDAHHAVEAVFKAFGRALNEATGRDARLKGSVLSTKGSL